MCNKEVSRFKVTRDDLQRRFLAQHSVVSWLQHCFEWLRHCSNIATLCCAKNRRCESFRLHCNAVLRFLAQHSVVSWLQHCFEWLRHCSNIATLCCTKNRRCESFRVCYTKQFAMTIFSATQHHNIVSNGCNIVPTLECCVALKIVLVNRLV